MSPELYNFLVIWARPSPAFDIIIWMTSVLISIYIHLYAGNKSNDQHFDTPNFGRWTSKGFTLKKTSGWNEGPEKDHSVQIGRQGTFVVAIVVVIVVFVSLSFLHMNTVVESP